MESRQSRSALVLATVAFATCFAVWGMLAPMAKTFQAELGLTEQQTWLLIAIPIILGSVLRLPMGMLADRFGGRIVYSSLLIFISLPAFMLGRADTYNQLLFWGLFLGMAGTSFPIGIAFTSKWYPPQKQGLALGIYGMGNGGQSIALFGIPVIALALGLTQAYTIFAATALTVGVLFLLLARNAPVKGAPKGLGEMAKVLKQPNSWLLSFFYFVTFGGFVALSVSLPKLLQEFFALSPAQAGLWVALFVICATIARPIGGWLSDKMGGARLLVFVFLGIAICGFGLLAGSMTLFMVAVVGIALSLGFGNGAVFKLVPEIFPKDVGTVTGLVGAIGGVGGFFPPLILGVIKTNTGAYSLGFILLAAFALACLALNFIVLLRRMPQIDTPAAPIDTAREVVAKSAT